MQSLSLGIEIRDFDLDRLGFSISVLEEGQRQASEGYLRMTLTELDTFLTALRAAPSEIDLTALEAPSPDQPRKQNLTEIPRREKEPSPPSAELRQKSRPSLFGSRKR